MVRLQNSSLLAWSPAATVPTVTNSTTSTSVPPRSWPPLSALRALASRGGESCVDACRGAGLVCEPAFYRFINNQDAFSK